MRFLRFCLKFLRIVSLGISQNYKESFFNDITCYVMGTL